MTKVWYAGFRVPLGEGDVNWPAVRKTLTDIGYTGWATAEIPGGGRERLEEIAQSHGPGAVSRRDASTSCKQARERTEHGLQIGAFVAILQTRERDLRLCLPGNRLFNGRVGKLIVLHAPDGDACIGQFTIQILISPIKVIDPQHVRFTLGNHAGQYKGHPGPQVGAHYRCSLQAISSRNKHLVLHDDGVCSHPMQLGDMLEPVVIHCVTKTRIAGRLGQQDGPLGL